MKGTSGFMVYEDCPVTGGEKQSTVESDISSGKVSAQWNLTVFLRVFLKGTLAGNQLP